MNSTEQLLRRAMDAIATEAPIVAELRHPEVHRRIPRYAVPLVAAIVAVVLVLGFVELRGEGSNENAPATDPTKDLTVDAYEAYRPWGIYFSADLTSTTPTRVTSATLDPAVAGGRASGDLWDPTLPDPEVGFDYVDLDDSKAMGVEFTFLPRCDVDTDWEQVTVNFDASTGPFSASAPTPGLTKVVTDWCASPIAIRVGSGSASGNWCKVSRDFEFTNPSGRPATIALTTPGWTAESLDLDAGDYEGIMVVESDRACELPQSRTEFTVQYEDGSSERISGPNPLKDM